MKVQIETNPYNNRRYGKPWIALVTFADAKGEFAWGDFIANDGPGSSGLLELSVNPGDIVAKGQKDHRGNGTSVDWFAVGEDGALVELGGKVEALKRWRERNAAVEPKR